MIYDSSFWKDDLIKLGSKLEKRYNQKRWSERSFAAVEKEVFIGFYMVRKLIESKKVSASLTRKRIQVTKYPIKDTKINWRLIDYWNRLYNLYKGQKTSLELDKLCNQFLHSYIFSPFILVDNSLLGFFICSDWVKNKHIYYVTLNKVVDIFKSVGGNYPYTSKIIFNENTEEYEIKQE